MEACLSIRRTWNDTLAYFKQPIDSIYITRSLGFAFNSCLKDQHREIIAMIALFRVSVTVTDIYFHV